MKFLILIIGLNTPYISICCPPSFIDSKTLNDALVTATISLKGIAFS